jgi:hypothetical protein
MKVFRAILILCMLLTGCKGMLQRVTQASSTPAVSAPSDWQGFTFGKSYDELRGTINTRFASDNPYCPPQVVEFDAMSRECVKIISGCWRNEADGLKGVTLVFDRAANQLIEANYWTDAVDSTLLINAFVQRYGTATSTIDKDSFIGKRALVWRWSQPDFRIISDGHHVRYIYLKDYVEFCHKQGAQTKQF